MRSVQERGFTLPELVVVIVVIGLLLGAAAALTRPRDFKRENLRAERALEVAAIAQGIKRYVAATGYVPAGMPSKLTPIGSSEDAYDVCTMLVPAYLPDVPLDPEVGLKVRGDSEELTEDRCREKGVAYASGYAIYKEKNGYITISALLTKEQPVRITVAIP